MMIQGLVRRFALILPMLLASGASHAQAAFIGSFGINGILPSISPSAGLLGATTFTIGSMATNGVTTDDFNGIPSSSPFSGGTFTLNTMTGFNFSSATYGTFTQTAAPILTSVGTSNGVLTSEAFYIMGTYQGGAVGALAEPASFTVSFTQNGGPGNSISASGTLNIPPFGTVPEPASFALLLIGTLGTGALSLLRRRHAS